jgi:hypothetical protein
MSLIDISIQVKQDKAAMGCKQNSYATIKNTKNNTRKLTGPSIKLSYITIALIRLKNHAKTFWHSAQNFSCNNSSDKQTNKLMDYYVL